MLVSHNVISAGHGGEEEGEERGLGMREGGSRSVHVDFATYLSLGETRICKMQYQAVSVNRYTPSTFAAKEEEGEKARKQETKRRKEREYLRSREGEKEKRKKKERKVGALFHGCGGGPHA